MEKFTKLGLSKELTDVLKQSGFKEPSEIQEKAIPLAMAGKDIIGGSATGSGKTLAFASAIIENLKPNNEIQALIMTPTRELAEQVANSIKKFSKNKKLNTLAIYGGVSIEPQMRKLATTDILVGTPGRILDHINRRTLKLNKIKFLVLDEVDRMFDMGFHRDVEKIIDECPKERQTMLFSATISATIDHLAKKHTRNAKEISVQSYVDRSKLKQIYYDIQNNAKFSLLVHLLNNEKSNLVMVFCNTRRNVDVIATNLTKNNINAIAIHGGLAQNKRTKIMKDFKDNSVCVLVCTDVAARGLDIQGVSHVYNYDLPPTSNDYIHRIGRTARAGEEGIAINLLSNRDYENFDHIKRDESLIIKPQKLPQFKTIYLKTEFKRRFGNQNEPRKNRRHHPNTNQRNPPRRKNFNHSRR